MESPIAWYNIRISSDSYALEFPDDIEYELIPSIFPCHVFFGYVAYGIRYSIFLEQLKMNPDPPRVPIPLIPLPFKGAPSQDVRSWLKSMEIVFLAKIICTPTDIFRWIRSFVAGQSANFFDSLPAVPSWEEFKDVWIKRYTV